MSRKTISLALAICMIFSCIVTALAAEPEKELAATGAEITPATDTGNAEATPLLTLDQVSERAQQLHRDLDLAVRQARNTAMATAMAAATAKSVLVDQYGGAMVVNGSAPLYNSADDDAGKVRTVPYGKVARLKDSGNGWYRVSFDTCSGYMKADDCLVVRYSDYENTSAASLLIDDLLAYARTYIGTPYVYGGNSRSGIDCSAFTQQVFNHFGYNLPRTVSAQYAVCRRVSDSERRPGDLLFFNTCGGLSHIGIYMGNGQFIHAGSIYGVSVRSLSESYFANTYLFAGRIIGK